MAVGPRIKSEVTMPAEEQALTKALDAAEPKATAAIAKEDFTAAMAALASLRAPIDAFFDKVTVNADDRPRAPGGSTCSRASATR